MIIDSGHKRWAAVTTALAVVAAALYGVTVWKTPNGPSGGSWPGLLFGIAGSSLMLFAGLLSARKQVPTWRVGRASTWLKGHIWLGMLSVPLIAFHSAFRWGGPLEIVLWIVFGVIVASGLFGLALQQFLTRMMTTGAPLETIYEQIPQVCAAMLADSDALVAGVCGPLEGLPAPAAEAAGEKKGKPKKAEPLAGSGPLKEFYLHEVRPFLSDRFSRTHRLADAPRVAATFAQVRVVLPTTLHDAIEQLQARCEERRQLALQARLHHWLHGWLFVHVPLSVALLVLGVAHAIVALRY